MRLTGCGYFLAFGLAAAAAAMMAGDCVIQVFAWCELDTLAGRHVDLLACLGVDANAGGGVFHREHTEPDQANGVAFFQGFEDGFERAIDENGALLNALVRLGCDAA